MLLLFFTQIQSSQCACSFSFQTSICCHLPSPSSIGRIHSSSISPTLHLHFWEHINQELFNAMTMPTMTKQLLMFIVNQARVPRVIIILKSASYDKHEQISKGAVKPKKCSSGEVASKEKLKWPDNSSQMRTICTLGRKDKSWLLN